MNSLVIFRQWRDTGSVLALFPEIAADHQGHCECYEHIGQHGGADYFGVIQATRPAKSDASKALAAELTQQGYNLKFICRASRRMHDNRLASV